MNFFTVRVGKNTRRGNFKELYQQTVSVPDNITKRELHNYYDPRYSGFDVKIDVVEVLNISDVPAPKPIPNPEYKNVGQLKNIRVKLNDDEKKLLNERSSFQDKARYAESDLRISIEKRYKQLSYVYSFDSLNIEINCCNEVYIRNLNIKSDEFLNIIKNGVEDELLIEERVTNSVLTDDDIPY